MAYQQKEGEDQLKRLGGLWARVSKRGNKFLSGSIETVEGEKVELLIFKNQNKAKEASPDYVVYLSKPREGATGNQQQNTTARRPAPATRPAPAKQHVPADEENSDDLPF